MGVRMRPRRVAELEGPDDIGERDEEQRRRHEVVTKMEVRWCPPWELEDGRAHSRRGDRRREMAWTGRR